MNFEFLPKKYIFALNDIKVDKLSEIRIRVGFPVKLKYLNEYIYLSKNGLTLLRSEAIIASCFDIEEILGYATEKSIYAYNENIKQGFLTLKNGVRIGLSGECVFENGAIKTIKNINSLNVRIPQEIYGCSNKIFEEIINENSVYNSLIISPPAFGKTTILKDLIRKLNEYANNQVLVIDERGEFSFVKGENVDLITYSNKLYAFEYAIRSLAPTVIITDELSGEKDWECVISAKNSGVKIIASCHGESLDSIKNKKYFNKNVFDRYFILESLRNPGILKEIYNSDF